MERKEGSIHEGNTKADDLREMERVVEARLESLKSYSGIQDRIRALKLKSAEMELTIAEAQLRHQELQLRYQEEQLIHQKRIRALDVQIKEEQLRQLKEK